MLLLLSALSGKAVFAEDWPLYTPTGGVDTSDGVFDPSRLAADDNVYENYNANRDAYDDAAYQEYTFTVPPFAPGSYLTGVQLDFVFFENSLGGAKLLVWDHDADEWVTETIDVASTNNVEIRYSKSLLDFIRSIPDAENLVIRFEAYKSGGGPKANVDHVQIGFSTEIDPSTPAVHVVSPAAGSLYSSSIPVKADVTDEGGSGLQRVVLEYAPAGSGAWVPITSLGAPPYAADWLPPAAGVYDIRASALDWAGNSGESVVETVTYNSPPRFVNPVPARLASVPTTTPAVEMDVLDAEDGVNSTSIRLDVDGVDVTSRTLVTPVAGGFHLAFAPDPPFLWGSQVSVHVEASDNAGNRGAETYFFYIHMAYYPGDIIIDMNHGDAAAQQLYDAYGLVLRLADAGIDVDWVIRRGKSYGAADFSAQTDGDPNPLTPGPDGTVLLRDYAAGPFLIRDPNPATPEYNEAWDMIDAIETQQGYDVNFDELRETIAVSREDVHFITYMPTIAVADNIANKEVELAKIPYEFVLSPGAPADPETVAGGALFSRQADPLCGRIRLYDLYMQGHYDWTKPDANELAAIGEFDLFINKAGMSVFECLSASVEDTAHWITEPGRSIVEGAAAAKFFTPDPTRLDHPFLQTMDPIPIEGGAFPIWDGQQNVFKPNLQNILFDAVNDDIGYIFGAVGSGKAYYMGGHERKQLSDRRLLLDAIAYNVVYPKYFRRFDPNVLVRGDETEVLVSIVVTGGSLSLDNEVIDTLDPYSLLIPGSVVLYVPGSSFTYNETLKTLQFRIGDFNPNDYPGGLIGTYKVRVNVPFEGFIKILDHKNSYTDEWGARYTFESTGCAEVEAVPPLKIRKSASLPVVPLGQTTRVTLTLEAHNYSDRNSIRSIVVKDALPAGVTFVPDSIHVMKGRADWDVTTPGMLTWDVGGMVPQEVAFLTFDVDIRPAAVGSFLINDGAVITGVTGTGHPVSDTSEDVTVDVRTAVGILDFSLVPDRVPPGTASAFTFCAGNVGTRAGFVRSKDSLEISIPPGWGEPAHVTLPSTPTPKWVYAWSAHTRKLKFFYIGPDFNWDTGVSFCFGFELTAPALAEVAGFEAQGTLAGGTLRYGEEFAVEVMRHAGVDLEADQVKSVSPCETVFFLHTLTNRGNGIDVFDLDSGSLLGWTVELYRDTDGSGTYTPADTPFEDTDGDGEADTGPLRPSGSVAVLAVVNIPESGGANQTEVTQVFALSSYDEQTSDSNRDETRVGPGPAVVINPPNPQICSGNCLRLDAAPAEFASYLWSTGEKAKSIRVCPGETTDYSVLVTDTLGCSAQDARTLIVRPLPHLEITPETTESCAGECVNLGAGAGFASYLWSTGEMTETILVCPTVSTKYVVTVADSFGCEAEDSVMVTVRPLPVVAIAPAGAEISRGHCVELDAGPGYASYLWSTGETTQTITVCPVETTTYSVEVTDSFGCRNGDEAPVRVHDPPSVSITPGQTAVCLGECTVLDAGPHDGSYLWSTGETTQTITVCPTESIDYSVTVTDEFGGLAQDTITVLVRPLPDPAVSPSNSDVSRGLCADLDAGPGFASYHWSSGETTRTITVCPEETTTYTVAVADSFGCGGEAGATVGVHEPPAVSIRPVKDSVCLGDCTVLDAGPGFETYLWSTGEETQTVTVCPVGETAEYSVTVTDAFGGQAQASETITVRPLPAPGIGVEGTEVCRGGCVRLEAPPLYDGYEWSTGETTQGITVCPTATMEYRVRVRDSFGCEGEAGVTVTVHDPPVPGLAPWNIRICEGQSATLDAGAGFASYLWSTGETTQAMTVSPAETTVYGVAVVDAFGCRGDGQTTVEVLPWTARGALGNVLKATKNATSVNLDWFKAVDAGRFEVKLAESADFSDNRLLGDLPGAKSFVHEEILDNGTLYFYRVDGLDCRARQPEL
jgi:uncharacterized repeat protein (TIGR01451 family)